MTNKIDLEEFKDAILDYDCEMWYGEYQGRGFHEGYAVKLDSLGELFDLGMHLGSFEEFKNIGGPHIDNLGRGFIASWSKRKFTNAEEG